MVETNTNAFLDELADEGIVIDEMIVNPNPLQVTITWTIREIIPENLKEQYALEGIHDLCTKCEYIDIPQDGRFKTAYCTLHKKEILKSDSACNDYYQLKDRHR